MTTEHNTLTGSNLHEPKGVDSATVDKVYVSDGAGSGTWQKIGSDQLDTTAVAQFSTSYITTLVDLTATTGHVQANIPVGLTGSVTEVHICKHSEGSSFPETLELWKPSGKIANCTSPLTANTSTTTSISTNNGVTAGDVIYFHRPGNGTGIPLNDVYRVTIKIQGS